MRKYVINGCFGGFRLPQEYLELSDCPAEWVYDESEPIRTDPRLIEIVESSSYQGDLEVVSIPDHATDTYIVEYDGAETLLYVENGFICEAN